VPCPFIGEQRFWALQLQDLGVANTQVCVCVCERERARARARFWALQLQDLGVANTQVSQLKDDIRRWLN
jgi:hypothetical protein